MGKTIIKQARGHGSLTYRVRRSAYNYRLKYPELANGEAEIVNLINSGGHTAPIAKIKFNNNIYFIPAAKGVHVGQKVSFGGKAEGGNILQLKDIPAGTEISNIESKPFDGGKFIRSGGGFATVGGFDGKKVTITFPSKKKKDLNPECRATIGRIAGHGRMEKPFVKAGKKHHLMKARNKLWPRTSAIKTNAIDHPFGSGRGKNPKSKIAKRHAPPGANVGLLRPRRTGRKKR